MNNGFVDKYIGDAIEGTVISDTVNLASRVEGVAPSNSTNLRISSACSYG